MSVLDTIPEQYHESEAREWIDLPRWIDSDITVADLDAITYGGCESGAYMPAVTYYRALDTMREHGDDIMDYIETELGEIPAPREPISWSGMACYYLSLAVELWAGSAFKEIADYIEDELDEEGEEGED